MPTTVLVTAAGGTVSSAVIRQLERAAGARVLRGTRHEREVDADTRLFDYARPETARAATVGVDAVFLLLPPGLSDPGERFGALVAAMSTPEPPHVVFMAVQGVEHRGFLPHAKAEAAIRVATDAYTFLRPAYFMQNLETAFGADIRERDELVAPAGEAALRWIDVEDVARAAAVVLADPAPHRGRAYTLAAGLHTLGEAADLLSEVLGRRIAYRSPNPVRYFLELRRRGKPVGMAMAQTLIHFAERFTEAAPASGDFTRLTGRAPATLGEYVERVWRRA